MAVGDLTVKDRADQLAIAQHDLLVETPGVVAQGDLVVALVGGHQRAGRKDVDAGDLEAGRERLGRERRRLVAGELRGADLRLIPQRRDQAEHLAAMLDAFADREDVRIAGAHVVVDGDAAIDIESGCAREIDIGADADGEHHEIGRDRAPVGELHALGALGAQDFLGLPVCEERDAALVEVALQELSGGRVELALHQRRHQMDERDRHAALLEAPCRFEAEQAAADHDSALMRARGRQHLVDIGEVAEGADARQAKTGNRRRHGTRAGGDQAVDRKER